MMQGSDWLIFALLVLLVSLPVAQRALRRRAGRRHQERGKAGERLARQLLRQEGYHIIGEQVRRPVAFYVDGMRHEQDVSCDFLVRRGLRRYAVEVKSGKASRATTASVRRQLFEYRSAYGGCGLLLVDTNRQVIEEIRFEEGLQLSQLLRIFAGLALGLGLGALFWL